MREERLQALASEVLGLNEFDAAAFSEQIDHIDVPANAARAEIVAHSVRALAADGVKFEEPDLFSLPGGGLDWPK